MDRLAGLAQRIEDWGVISGKRLAGTVADTPGHPDGARIVTSRVVEVRLMGHGWADHYPVAFTASGSAYRLGAPSPLFGQREADEFIYGKWEALPTDSGFAPAPFDSEGTVIGGLLDFSAHGIEHIDVYASSFQRR